MHVDFDPAKDEANIAKHGVSLAFGARILADPGRIDILDLRADYAEDRYVTYGKVDNRVWVCVYTLRKRVPRIISVRKANDRETLRYRDAPR